MLTAGAACPPELGQQSSKLLPHPAQRREHGPRSRPVTHSPPPHHNTPASAWKRCTRAGPLRLGKSRPPTSLGPHPSLPPPPQEGQGDYRGHGVEVPRGAWSKHGTEITVIVSTHPGQRPARRLPRPPGLARSPLLGGSDLGGKQAGFWLALMRPGNWALGREDCSGLWVRAGREQRGSVCVCVCAHVRHGVCGINGYTRECRAHRVPRLWCLLCRQWGEGRGVCTAYHDWGSSCGCRTAEHTRQGWDGAGWDVCGHMCSDSSKHS